MGRVIHYKKTNHATQRITPHTSKSRLQDHKAPRSQITTPLGNTYQIGSNRFSITYTGHSFPRRSKCANLNQHYNRDTYRDTTDPEAIDLAAAHKVSAHVTGIRTFCTYLDDNGARRVINNIQDIILNLTDIASHNSDMYIMDVGSNECASAPEGLNYGAVWTLANNCRNIAAALYPKVCIFMGIVPRLGGLTTSPDTFRRYATWFNEALAEFERQALQLNIFPQNLRYHHMQGWWMKKVNGVDVECPVTDWCAIDRIHPTTDKLREKHSKTIKKLIRDEKNIPHH